MRFFHVMCIMSERKINQKINSFYIITTAYKIEILNLIQASFIHSSECKVLNKKLYCYVKGYFKLSLFLKLIGLDSDFLYVAYTVVANLVQLSISFDSWV